MASLAWQCGHCGQGVSAEVAAGKYVQGSSIAMQCPLCHEFTARSRKGVLYPPFLGNRGVKHLPPDVAAAWHEAVLASGVGACTAAEIMCRKILMHVAVDVAKSKVGESFRSYIDDLDDKGYIPTGLKSKIEEIRDRGNVANHDLPTSTAEEAERTMAVTQHLLASVYELPNS